MVKLNLEKKIPTGRKIQGMGSPFCIPVIVGEFYRAGYVVIWYSQLMKIQQGFSYQPFLISSRRDAFFVFTSYPAPRIYPGVIPGLT